MHSHVPGMNYVRYHTSVYMYTCIWQGLCKVHTFVYIICTWQELWKSPGRYTHVYGMDYVRNTQAATSVHVSHMVFVGKTSFVGMRLK